jgi:hypothetical protein
MLAFLAKGLFRDRSRSLFPLLTCAIGVTLVVLMVLCLVVTVVALPLVQALAFGTAR